MINKRRCKAALLFFLLAGCVSRPIKDDSIQEGAETAANLTPLLRDYAVPAGLEFRPAAFPLPAAAPGVGAITRDQRDPLSSLTEGEKRAVAESFRAAYSGGLLRGLSLEGTLGGDLVHSWPPEAALCLAQNWRSREGTPDSWGLPSLVLAVRGAGAGETRIVRGDILDQYGKSGGRDRANGVAGYGAPLGEEFLYGNGIAQWFEHGLIAADPPGTVFFEAAEPPLLPPEGTEPYAGDDGAIGELFRQARRRGAYSNLPELRADAPALRLDIPETETLPGLILYFQTFNRGNVLLLLNPAPELPLQTRIVAGAFLDAFLGEAAGAGLEGRLLRGIERYGAPLTDAYPAPEGGAYRETQRFVRGWMALRPPMEPH
jgi:hypothetical protein